MAEILLICVILYIIVLVVLHIFMEKRLNHLHRANTQRVPSDNNEALMTLHKRLIVIIRVLSLLLLSGGIFVLVTLF